MDSAFWKHFSWMVNLPENIFNVHINASESDLKWFEDSVKEFGDILSRVYEYSYTEFKIQTSEKNKMWNFLCDVKNGKKSPGVRETSSTSTELSQTPSAKNDLFWIRYKNSNAVFGNTEKWETNLKFMKGRFNPRLRPEGKDGRVVPGWIFHLDRWKEIDNFVNHANSGRIQPMKEILGPRERCEMKSSRPKYQKIVYEVALPYIGQTVRLNTQTEEFLFKVVDVRTSSHGTIDLIHLESPIKTSAVAVVICGVWEILDYGKKHTLTFVDNF